MLIFQYNHYFIFGSINSLSFFIFTFKPSCHLVLGRHFLVFQEIFAVFMLILQYNHPFIFECNWSLSSYLPSNYHVIYFVSTFLWSSKRYLHLPNYFFLQIIWLTIEESSYLFSSYFFPYHESISFWIIFSLVFHKLLAPS